MHAALLPNAVFVKVYKVLRLKVVRVFFGQVQQGRFIQTRIVEILKLLKFFVHIATVSLVIGSVLAIKHITHIFPEIEKVLKLLVAN
ncbi:hypothetical protein YC2023_081698 [Brassica napus]